MASAHCTMIATDGVRKRGCTSASDLKKYPSRAMAKGTRAPLMMVPLRVTSMETAMAAETRPAPVRPRTSATASEAGRSDAGDRRCRQHVLHRGVDENVEQSHGGHAPDQRQWNVALRIANSRRPPC